MNILQMIHDADQNKTNLGFDKHHLVELLRAEIHLLIVNYPPLTQGASCECTGMISRPVYRRLPTNLVVSSLSTRHSVIGTDESSNNHNYNNPDLYLIFTRLRVRNPVNWCNIISLFNNIKLFVGGYNGFHPPAFAGGLPACSVKPSSKHSHFSPLFVFCMCIYEIPKYTIRWVLRMSF